MSSSQEFQVGVAWRDISPENPELLTPTGMGRLVPTRGVLDPLRMEAMAIRAGGELAFFTTSDLRVIEWEWMGEIRQAVAKKTGADPMKVFFSAVHNHCSSPAAVNRSPQAKAAEQKAIRKIVDAFIDSCVEAAGNLAPAEIAAVTTHLLEPMGENRRARLSNGTCANAWGSGPVLPPGKKYAGPGGPDSTRVDILCARRVGEERPFAVFTSYASHPHLYALPYFSGETVGALKRRIEQLLPGALSLHADHCGGDVDLHCVHPAPDEDAAQVEWFRKSTALLAERFGRCVAPAIPKTGYFRPQALRHRYYASEGLQGPLTMPLMAINVVALDDLALISLPCELFIEFGMRIHAGSPFAHSILMAYDSTDVEYTPPAIAFEQGSYEVMRGPRGSEEEARTRGSKIQVQPDTGEVITAKTLEILRELR
jgi:neutral ceramidase